MDVESREDKFGTFAGVDGQPRGGLAHVEHPDEAVVRCCEERVRVLVAGSDAIDRPAVS